MIEKMKFLSITGPKADIDRVVNQYLSKYEIHLENALSELKTVEELRPFMEINPYKELLNKANEFVSQLSQPVSEEPGSMDVDTAVKTIQELSGYAANFQEKRTELSKKHEELLSSLQWIEPFLNFDFNIHEVFGFKFVKYRFGKIAHEYYEKFEKYVYDNLDTVFFKCASDEQYVWGVYFVPATQAVKVDAVYSSLHFERMRIPDEYEGTPEEAVSKLKKDLASIDEQLKNCQAEVGKKLESRRSDLLKARNTLDSLSTNFDVRKLAACTKAKNDKQVFYILCGWMTERDAERFQKDIEDDVNLYCILEDDENNILNVSAIEKNSQKQSKILIDNANTNLSQQQIEEMIATANAFRKDDEENAKKLEYISDLDNLVRSIQNELEEKGATIPADKRQKIEDSALGLQDFLYACAGSDTNEILASINNARQLLSVLEGY